MTIANTGIRLKLDSTKYHVQQNAISHWQILLLANSHSTPTPTNRHVVNTKLTKPGFEAVLLLYS
jgi:hypothetical protein